jgi:hypothetical protein
MFDGVYEVDFDPLISRTGIIAFTFVDEGIVLIDLAEFQDF